MRLGLHLSLSSVAISVAWFVGSGPTVPTTALTFDDGTPLQFDDNAYLELA